MKAPRPSLRLVRKRAAVRIGWASPKTIVDGAMSAFAQTMSDLADVDFETIGLASYDAVAQHLHRGEIDIAWLAPVPFIALLNAGAVVPLASARAAPYQSALIVRAASKLTNLSSVRGWRAAWVDRHSASGFIVPRVKLARLGVGPSALARERFFGTHEAVVRAVASGDADFGATYAWRDSKGAIRGPWLGGARATRVLATFGEIPSDVLVARSDLPKHLRKSVVWALKRMTTTTETRTAATNVFGSTGFCRPDLASYERLRVEAYDAHRRGLLTVDGPDALDVAKTLRIALPVAAEVELDENDVIAV